MTLLLVTKKDRRRARGFVAVCALLFAGALVFTARARGWLEDRISATIHVPIPVSADDAPERRAFDRYASLGLAAGADVEALGVTVGTVERIEFALDAGVPALLAHVSLSAGPQSAARLLRTDCTAVVRRRFGVAGSAYFQLHRGKGATALADTPGEHRIEGSVAPDLLVTAEAVLADLASEQGDLRTVLRRMREVTDPEGRTVKSLATMIEDVTRTTADLRKLAGSLAGENGVEGVIARLRTLTSEDGDLDRALRQLRATSETAKAATEKTAKFVDEFVEKAGQPGTLTSVLTEKSDLPQLVGDAIRKAAESAERANRILDQAQELVSQVTAASRQAPGAMLAMEALLQESTRTVRQIQRHWLIRSYLEEEPADSRLSPFGAGETR